MDFLPVKRAILSVTDKSGIEELGKFLHEHQVELISTGGTRKKLMESGLPVTSVSAITGFPEIMGGRVKTLHPNIHAGILADKDNPDHLGTLAELKLRPFDLICVNLYNFAQAVNNTLDLKAAVEEIDIGGPTMLRAGAKNFHSMAVIPEAKFYSRLQEELSSNDMCISLAFRQEMAAYTFGLISEYDKMIADYLGGSNS